MQVGRAVLGAVLALGLIHQMGSAAPVVVYKGRAIDCDSGQSRKVSMHSTSRLPEASGAAKVECKGGMTEIQVELDSMKPASLFGGDYNTFVLWVVPPRGPAKSLGEIVLDGSESKLQSNTPESTFGLIVTAEPHYLVRAPSAFVVLENASDRNGQAVEQNLITGSYNFSRSSLDDVKAAKGKVRSDVRQAFTAVRLAQRAGADSLAGEWFAEAERALNETLSLWQAHKDTPQIAAQARETVRLAVAAQHLAQERALERFRAEAEGSGGGNGETERVRSARR